MKTLYKNAKIYDGTGNAPFTGDVLVEGDRIVGVGRDTEAPDDAEVVDLTGLSLSSGFIDAHSHNDWHAIQKEPVKYFEPFIRQGITSFITGNCGISAYGFEESTDTGLAGAGLFGFKGATGVYPTLESYFRAIDGNTPCNIAALVGHCTVRAAVAGMENRPLTDKEKEKMLSLIRRDFEAGACGASLGLMYVPSEYAPTDELRGIALLCDEYQKPLTVHPRAESTVSMAYPLLGRAHILRAMDELREITRGTRVKLQYSHMIFVGSRSFKWKNELLRIMEEMRRDGVDVCFDIYNETLGVSVITVVMPAWYESMSPEEKRKPFNKLKFKVMARITSRLLGFGWKDIQLAWLGEGTERWQGKTVAECAKEMGCSNPDAYLSLCEMSNFKGRVNMGPYSSPEIIHDLEKREECLYITDAWVEDHGVQNPAIYDNHPKFLRDALLGLGAEMPMAVRKMTGAVADRFALKDRGYVKSGYFADLTVFDENALRTATPDREEPFGIERVIINGTPVLTGKNLDREALRHTGRAMKAR